MLFLADLLASTEKKKLKKIWFKTKASVYRGRIPSAKVGNVCWQRLCNIFEYSSPLDSMFARARLKQRNNNNTVQRNLGTGRVATPVHPKSPIPVARRGPQSNTPIPRPIPRTTPNRSSDGTRTLAQLRRKLPIRYNGAPHIPRSKILLAVDLSPNQTTCLIIGPTWPTIPNRIHIRSAVLPQCTGQTDGQTNRWL